MFGHASTAVPVPSSDSLTVDLLDGKSRRMAWAGFDFVYLLAIHVRTSTDPRVDFIATTGNGAKVWLISPTQSRATLLPGIKQADLIGKKLRYPSGSELWSIGVAISGNFMEKFTIVATQPNGKIEAWAPNGLVYTFPR